jgi:hypothetical protein
MINCCWVIRQCLQGPILCGVGPDAGALTDFRGVLIDLYPIEPMKSDVR